MAGVVAGMEVRLSSGPLKSGIDELNLLEQSLLFAELSKLAYQEPEVVAGSTAAIGLPRYEYLDRDGAQAYVLSNQRDCIVVCRGTEPHEWNDIKADVNVVSVLAETIGKVHRGFKREVDDLWPRLERLLRNHEQTLWFAGHSLGGAMATICAGRCKLAEIPANPSGLFTFGSPRVGDRRYINFVQIPHYRWVNNNDIVCRVPPRWMGYSHSGRELYFNALGQLREYSPWRRFRDRWHGFLVSLRNWQFDHLSDHSMDSYIASIEAAIRDVASGKIPSPKKDTEMKRLETANVLPTPVSEVAGV